MNTAWSTRWLHSLSLRGLPSFKKNDLTLWQTRSQQRGVNGNSRAEPFKAPRYSAISTKPHRSRDFGGARRHRSVPRGPWILGRTRIFLGTPFLAGEPFAARRDEKNHEQSG